MEAYIYDADSYCAACAEKITEALRADDKALPADYPQGPYADGGGESDVPEHCAKCGVYLDAPLTDAGVAYAINYLTFAVHDFTADETSAGRREPLETWATDLKDYGLEDRQAAILALYLALPEPKGT